MSYLQCYILRQNIQRKFHHIHFLCILSAKSFFFYSFDKSTGSLLI